MVGLGCSPYLLGVPPEDATLVTQPFTNYIDSMASVCVIRSSPIARDVTFLVRDNNVLVGATRGPTFFCYRAQPGRHRIVITSDDGEQRFDVTLAPLHGYYLDQGLSYRFGFVLPRGVWVDEATAIRLARSSQHRILLGAPARDTLLVGTAVVAAAT